MNSALGVGWSAALTQKRLQAIVETITAEQRADNRLVFLGRTPITPSTNKELMGTFEGETYAADLIMDDQAAVVHDVGKFQFQKSNIANLKHGFLMGQEQIEELEYLMMQDGGVGSFANQYLARNYARLIRGIQHRLEALIVSAYRDETVYNRYGIIIRGTWGMPSDLKMDVETPWDDVNNATPVDDLQYMKNEVAPDMETEFDRATMSRRSFGQMVRTKNFQDKARIIVGTGFNLNFDIPANAFPNAFDDRMVSMAEAVVGMSFEIYDAGLKVKNDDGSVTRHRTLPHNEVILSSRAVDNNPEAIDVGNAIVTESLMAEYVNNTIVGGLPNRVSGPVAYAAPTTADLNPPGMTGWGVQRAFPRKWDKVATGLMRIGTSPT